MGHRRPRRRLPVWTMVSDSLIFALHGDSEREPVPSPNYLGIRSVFLSPVKPPRRPYSLRRRRCTTQPRVALAHPGGGKGGRFVYPEGVAQGRSHPCATP